MLSVDGPVHVEFCRAFVTIAFVFIFNSGVNSCWRIIVRIFLFHAPDFVHYWLIFKITAGTSSNNFVVMRFCRGSAFLVATEFLIARLERLV